LMDQRGQKKRLLIVGVSGLLGSSLARCQRDDLDVYGIYHHHPVELEGVHTVGLDVLDDVLLKQYIDQIQPQIVVNCAALTNIDYCEQHPDEAKLLNVDLVRRIVQTIEGKSVKLIHISTDNVFDGEKGDYCEDDTVNPINVYGHTKYEGEIEALKHENTAVVRTNIFGWNVQEKYSLAEWCINELSQGNHIKGFTDVYFSSIYTFDLAQIIQEGIDKDLKGIYHIASSSSTSKYRFLVNIAELFALDPSLIEPVEVAEFGFKAKRGNNLSMSVSKATKVLEGSIPMINDSAAHFYRDRQVKVGKSNES